MESFISHNDTFVQYNSLAAARRWILNRKIVLYASAKRCDICTVSPGPVKRF